MKNITLSKTVWFNVLYTVAEIALMLQDVMPPEYMPYAVAIQGIVNIVLRVWFTSTAVTFGKGK